MSTKEREINPSKRKTKKSKSSGRNANKTSDSDENQALAKEKNVLLRQIDFLNSIILDTKLKEPNKKGAGNTATSELTREMGEFSERTLDAEVDDPGLRKREQREQWTSRAPPPVVHKRDANCDENKTVVNTSLKSVQTSHDVNLRITQAFSHIGKGYSAIEKFCMVMNIDPFSSTTYGKCARRLDNAYTLASENIFAEIHREIKNVYENGAEITDLSVSFDGTWLTRGHTSLIGVGCVIDMLTGYVVDFEVMKKKVYGPDIVIKKEECINHVSKRLGTALRSTVKDCRAQGISLGGKAHGSLKEATIKKLTTYYQKAILRNKGDVNAMKKQYMLHCCIAFLQMLNLNIRSVLQEKTHGVSTNLQLLMGKNLTIKLNVGTPINEKFLPKILPIYQRLASNELLERCIRCGTQNANESLHSMIWAKCPKEIFVNKRRVKRAVTEAVCEYNKGTVRTIIETQKALGVATGGSTEQLATILDCRKQKFRKRRQNASNKLALKLIKKAIHKKELLARRREGMTYGAGQFKTNLF
ncbi:uncharacterized protein TNCV_3713831 [Trichonephila clavipes]|nr:uncharacterized protein TNCV_3713831 [Trichonephila clavipes]